eukprot:5488804-Alexandrium_andersonii.AAC.1
MADACEHASADMFNDVLAACKSLAPQQIMAACRKWAALVRLQHVDDPADVKLEEGPSGAARLGQLRARPLRVAQ